MGSRPMMPVLGASGGCASALSSVCGLAAAAASAEGAEAAAVSDSEASPLRAGREIAANASAWATCAIGEAIKFLIS